MPAAFCGAQPIAKPPEELPETSPFDPLGPVRPPPIALPPQSPCVTAFALADVFGATLTGAGEAGKERLGCGGLARGDDGPVSPAALLGLADGSLPPWPAAVPFPP